MTRDFPGASCDQLHDPLRVGEVLTRVTGWHAAIFVPAVRS